MQMDVKMFMNIFGSFTTTQSLYFTSPAIEIKKIENVKSTFDLDQTEFVNQLNDLVQGLIDSTTNEISTKGTILEKLNPSIDIVEELVRLQVDYN